MINGPKFLKTGKINERVLYRGSGGRRGGGGFKHALSA